MPRPVITGNYAQINGHELFYATHGQGQPMLLMHDGPGLDHTYFRPWFDPLGNRGVQLIYYDKLGQSHSTQPPGYEHISFDTWTAEADGLRAYLGHEQIILFGHAFGGFIAQEYALHYSNHLTGLILCGTAPALDYLDGIIANAQAHSTSKQAQAALQMFSSLSTFNTLSRLGEMTTPTLVLAGREDWLYPPAQAERIHAWLPNSTLVILDHSGHFPFIEEPDKFMTIVADWITGLS